MANGILGSQDLPATTYTEVYTVPADTFSVVTVNFVNKNTSSVTIRLGIAKVGESGPLGDDYLEYDTEILPNGVLERTGIVLETGRGVYAYSSTTQVGVMVYGIETATA